MAVACRSGIGVISPWGWYRRVGRHWFGEKILRSALSISVIILPISLISDILTRLKVIFTGEIRDTIADINIPIFYRQINVAAIFLVKEMAISILQYQIFDVDHANCRWCKKVLICSHPSYLFKPLAGFERASGATRWPGSSAWTTGSRSRPRRGRPSSSWRVAPRLSVATRYSKDRLEVT